MMKIHECPLCKGKLRLKKVECQDCGVSFEGEIYTSSIVSLPEEQQKFIELFILNSGSLKEMAKILGVTYPTVRLKLDRIIKQLQSEIYHKEAQENTN